ncbi:hypothetical protein ABZ567_04125 [Streptomyces sp. NPDC016459]|uniref:hypothetical protein n=1 Tax=Streptomyces sp. NPDC016459 TaxID=3157190 RepID=UPI003410837A
MASITMDLQDFNSLMGLGTARRRAMFLDLYNTGRAKAGQSTASGVESVAVTPSSPSATIDPIQQVVARAKTAIAAAS